LTAKAIDWHEDWDKARAAAADRQRDMFIWVTKAEGRTYERLDKLWQNEKLARAISRAYVPVKVISPNASLEPKLGVRGAPAIVVMTAEGSTLACVSNPDFRKADDVTDWLVHLVLMHSGLDARFKKVEAKPQDWEAAMELARDLLKLGLALPAARALKASADYLEVAVEEDVRKHKDPEKRDPDLPLALRDVDLLLADARWLAAAQRAPNAEALARKATATYGKYWDALSEESDARLAGAALALAYEHHTARRTACARELLRDTLNKLPQSARADELRYWIALYSYWQGDQKQALADFEAVVNRGGAGVAWEETGNVWRESAAEQVEAMKKLKPSVLKKK
jgi:TolA-binding protein